VDRPLDALFVRRRFQRRGVLAVLLISIAAFGFTWAPSFLRPSISRSEIRIARVQRGAVEAVISATGIVVPEVERVLSTPVDARVVRILKRPGASVVEGEPIVELDLSVAKLAVDRLDQNLALKRNQQERARLELESRLATIDNQQKAKELQLRLQEGQLKRRRDLREQRLISAEDLQQAELAAAQAAIELKQMQDDAAHARKTTRAELEGMDLELATLRGERVEAARQLSLATTKADRGGVVTWTVTEEGGSVRSGEPVARIADLSSFRVEATVSDVHAKRLSAGLPATVRVGDDTLKGTVSNVLPAVRDGILTFGVALENSASAILRPNLRVDVHVAVGRRSNVLTVSRGPAIEGEGSRHMFVVNGGRAEKKPVRIGLLGFDVCEIDGLSEHDEVIVSDMRAYDHLSEVRLK
jgi:HlyD family secretion protein